MKNKWRFFAATLAVVLCMTAFSVPALAYGDTSEPSESAPQETAQAEEQAETDEPLTVNVTENADGSHTVTIGDQSWTLPASQEQTGKVVNVSSYLNLRTGPGTDYTVIGHLLNGTSVEVLEESGGWYKVVVPEQTGYVCGKYLEVLSTSAESDENDADMAGLLEILLKYCAADGG